MKRVMLTVAYDGTNYHGWQLQPNIITIEAVLNKALSQLFEEDIRVIGASRTDTGVHALGNIAVFDTNTRMPADKISYALNQRLPEDVRIQESKEVASDFHPRRQNSRKTYEYLIYNAVFPQPVHRLYSHFSYYKLDIDRMQAAAKFLLGEHDFKSFCSVNTMAESTVRTIYELSVSKENDMIHICVTGSGFLYNMVRIIAGTLIEVGRGNLEPEQIPAILLEKDRKASGPTAPACGLTLIKYNYEQNI